MSEIFRDLGIFGISDSIEAAVLAGLLTGEPNLFIGEPGSAKTELIYQIGYAMRESSKRANPDDPAKWERCHVYDTSKVNFEDLIGYPSPDALTNGKIEFIKGKTTIWDKTIVGLDELNRCSEDRQNNILEVLRHKTCQGGRTKIWGLMSAINPLGDAGTDGMSSALIDRHTFYLHFPKFDKMDAKDRAAIATRVGSFDSSGLRHWSGEVHKFDVSHDDEDKSVNDYLADQGDRLKKILTKAASLYKTLSQQWMIPFSTLMSELVNSFSMEKDKKGIPTISGRRAGMIVRGAIAYRAIEIARAEFVPSCKPKKLDVAMTNIVMMALPVGVEKPASPDILTRLETIVNTKVNYWHSHLLGSDDKGSSLIYDMYYSQEPVQKLMLLLQTSGMDNLPINTTWKNVRDSDKSIEYILYALQNQLPEAVPGFLIEEGKRAQINDELRQIDSQLKLSEHARPLYGDFIAMKEKYKQSGNRVLEAVALLSIVHINNVSSSLDQAYVKLRATQDMLEQCENLMNARLEASGRSNDKSSNEKAKTEGVAEQTRAV